MRVGCSLSTEKEPAIRRNHLGASIPSRRGHRALSPAEKEEKI